MLNSFFLAKTGKIKRKVAAKPIKEYSHNPQSGLNMNNPVRSAGYEKTDAKFRILKGFNNNIYLN